jgi:hypothetical protein
MGRQHRRIGLGAGVAALAAMAVAGCSGSGGGSNSGGLTGLGSGGLGKDSAITLVADAMDQASKAGTVKVTGTMEMTGQTSMSGTLTAQEEYSPNLEMSMSMDMDGQNISEILVGSTIYMKYDALSSMTGGKPWASIDLSKAGGSMGSLSSMLNSAKSYNPTTQLSALLASGAVTEVGKETVDGQQTTHYHGTLTAAQVLSLGGSQSHLTADQISTLKSQFKTSGLKGETIDLWTASTNLPVEVKVTAQMNANGMTGMTMDMHLSDWGAPVNIGAPPANEVYDMTSVLNSSLSGDNG